MALDPRTNPHPARLPEHAAALRLLLISQAPRVRDRIATLARAHGFDVRVAPFLDEAIAAVQGDEVDVVFLEAQEGEAGLEPLLRLREENRVVPVVLVSRTEDRRTVQRALDMGAANFVRRPVSEEEIRFVLDHLHQALEAEEDLQDIVAVAQRSTRVVLPSRPALLPRAVAYLGRELVQHYPGWEIPLPEVKLALFEALTNALEHGNLEIAYEDKAVAVESTEGMRNLVQERLTDPRLATRRIRVLATYGPDRVVYRVQDEGRGFDPAAFDAAAALASTTALHGRGLALIRHYMDEVRWNRAGNVIRMVRFLVPRRRRRPLLGPPRPVPDGAGDLAT